MTAPAVLVMCSGAFDVSLHIVGPMSNLMACPNGSKHLPSNSDRIANNKDIAQLRRFDVWHKDVLGGASDVDDGGVGDGSEGSNESERELHYE